MKLQVQHPQPETLSSPKSPRSSWNGISPTNTGTLEEHSGLLKGVYIICSSLLLKVCNKIKQIHTKIKWPFQTFQSYLYLCIKNITFLANRVIDTEQDPVSEDGAQQSAVWAFLLEEEAFG